MPRRKAQQQTQNVTDNLTDLKPSSFSTERDRFTGVSFIQASCFLSSYQKAKYSLFFHC